MYTHSQLTLYYRDVPQNFRKCPGFWDDVISKKKIITITFFTYIISLEVDRKWGIERELKICTVHPLFIIYVLLGLMVVWFFLFIEKCSMNCLLKKSIHKNSHLNKCWDWYTHKLITGQKKNFNIAPN